MELEGRRVTGRLRRPGRGGPHKEATRAQDGLGGGAGKSTGSGERLLRMELGLTIGAWLLLVFRRQRLLTEEVVQARPMPS